MSPPSSGTSGSTDRDQRLVVSFHDLHPGSRAEAAAFLAGLAARGVPRISLLVVPRWHGGPPITADPEFVRWLRARADEGHDICLHGFFHQAGGVRGGPFAQWLGRFYTQREGEFFQIEHATALDRLRRGLAILADEAGLPVVGFTAPAWLLSDGGREAARELGLLYTTTFHAVDHLQHGVRLPGPTLVFSCRTRFRRFVSRAWVRLWARHNRRAPLMRIAAHPGDFADPKVVASLYRLVEEALQAGRQPITYRDLLDPGHTLPAARRFAVA